MKLSPLASKLSVLAIAGICFGTQSTFAAMENFSYKSFRVNGFFATNSSGNSLSPELSWNPSYSLNEKWNLRGIVGAAAVKGVDESILMTEYGVMAAYKVMPTWEIEAGAGMQSWAGEDTSPMFSANVIKTLPEKYAKYIDGVFAGYSMVSHEEATSVFKVGVTLNFGEAK